MTLRIICTGFLATVSLRAPETLDPAFTQRIVRFELAWDTFIRRYFGCPEGVLLTDPEQCSTARRQLDVGAFTKAEARARELFGKDVTDVTKPR